ncbi:MAG: universal stress protein [Acidobacteria bacterium]|nr:universal stress protein [Acidobacteriota bacterium]
MSDQPILFPTDFSECAQSALTHALFHAESLNAPLHVLVAHAPGDVPPRWLSPLEVGSSMDVVMQQRLAEQLDPHMDRTMNIVQQVSEGESVPLVIRQYAEEINAAMIVMGTHGRRGLQHFLMGSVAEEVVRLAPCPVMTIRSGKKPVHLHAIRHILCPVDLSPGSAASLRAADWLAERNQAKITTLHVIEDHQFIGQDAARMAPISELIPDLQEKRLTLLKQFCNRHCQNPIDIHCMITVGRAYRRIQEVVEDLDIDAIALGTHGWSGFNRLLLGSTAERVIRTATVPVLSIKSKIPWTGTEH